MATILVFKRFLKKSAQWPQPVWPSIKRVKNGSNEMKFVAAPILRRNQFSWDVTSLKQGPNIILLPEDVDDRFFEGGEYVIWKMHDYFISLR